MAVMIYDSKGQPHTTSYWGVFKKEPYASGLSLAVSQIKPLAAWDFPNLLSMMIGLCKSDKDLIIEREILF